MTETDIAQTDTGDQTFVPGLDRAGQLTFELPTVQSTWLVGIARLDVMAELVGFLGRQPTSSVSAPVTHLADQCQLLRTRIQRRVDELVGDIGPVELRRVDVIDAQLHCSPQHPKARSRSCGGPNTPGPGSCMVPKPIRATGIEPK
ncbi:hypothetical protein [Mycobacterium sp. D16R24]|uniref:hypothetical protein n=1 Tax=Mycobacterium sp. D16R24 TaxID=1855656 RepID=UPI003369EECD